MTPDLLPALSRYAARDLRPGSGDRPHRPELWAFVARDRERITDIRIERTALIVVIDGAKEVTDTRGTHHFPKGSAMLLPPGWIGTVVNAPSEATGHYRALILEFPGDMVRRLLDAHPTARVGNRQHPHDFRVALTPALASAVEHAAAGLAVGSTLSPRLVEHRCMEVLLALLDDCVWWLGHGMPGGTADAVRQLVRAYPDQPWTARSVAVEMGLSTGTLRRRLADEDASVRRILTVERVAHARRLLESDGLSVQEAAEAVGYTSRSHFARRVRAVTGANPSDLRGDGR
ncbi:helix-turn-helix transcriptional regulator [Azospirillum argentinense]